MVYPPGAVWPDRPIRKEISDLVDSLPINALLEVTPLKGAPFDTMRRGFAFSFHDGYPETKIEDGPGKPVAGYLVSKPADRDEYLSISPSPLREDGKRLVYDGADSVRVYLNVIKAIRRLD